MARAHDALRAGPRRALASEAHDLAATAACEFHRTVWEKDEEHLLHLGMAFSEEC
jgi:hypothetical protein